MRSPQLTSYSGTGNVKAFSLRSGTRKWCSLLLNVVLDVLAETIRQDKEIKIIQIKKEFIHINNLEKWCDLKMG